MIYAAYFQRHMIIIAAKYYGRRHVNCLDYDAQFQSPTSRHLERRFLKQRRERSEGPRVFLLIEGKDIDDKVPPQSIGRCSLGGTCAPYAD